MKISFKKSINYETFFILLLILVWTRLIIVSYVYQTICLIPGLKAFADYLKIFIYIFASVLSIPYMFKIIKIKDIIFFLIFFVLYFLNINMFSRTSLYLEKNMVEILFINLPAYFIGLGMIKEKHIQVLYNWSKVCIIAILLHFLIFGLQSEIGNSSNAENMSTAYRLLQHLCLITTMSFKNKWKNNILYIIIGFTLLLASGSRGALLCFIIMCICCYLLSGFTIKKIFLSLFILVTVLLIYFNLYHFLKIVSSFLQQLNLSTRIIDSFLTGNFMNDNGRYEIKNYMIKVLKNNHWHGLGIAGDRNLISWMAYSHNILIEMILSYAIVLGSAIILVLFVIVLRAYFFADITQRFFIISLIFGGGLFKLFLSSSYLMEFQFFMLLGYCIMIVRNTNKLKFIIRK